MPIDFLYRPPAVVPRVQTREERRVSEAPTVESTTSVLKTRRSSLGHNSQRGIPEELSFENIVGNKRSPPCTLRDFMMYLHFFEHTVENMQFLLWHDDYTRRFNELPESEKSLSPAWDGSTADKVYAKAVNRNSSGMLGQPKASLDLGSRSEIGTENGGARDYKEAASQAFAQADLKWQPFTIQPLRDEVSRAIATYLTENGSRELNLTSRDRSTTLHALEHTTHPSAFQHARNIAESSLRDQSHPAFIRWTLRNGNPERIAFAHVCAGLLVPLAFVIGVLLTLSTCGRWWRVMGVLSLWPGMALFIAARRGICVILHAMGHRCQFRPWELGGSCGSNVSSSKDVEKAAISPWEDSSDGSGSVVGSSKESRDDYKKELKKVNIVKKIFCKDRYIEEPALRDIQTAIVLQSFFGATVASILFCCLFVPLPHGGYF